MSMYGVPTSQCEPIRNARLSPLPRGRFLEPEAVIAEGLKGKALPANIFSVPSRTIAGRIRKVSQYSVRSNDDNDDDHVSYLSAAEEEPEGSTDDDNDGGQLAARASRLKRRMPSIARSRSENDLRRGDKHVSYQRSHSPYLAVPDQEEVPIRCRTRSTKSITRHSGSNDDLRESKKRKSPKNRRKSLPASEPPRPPLVKRMTSYEPAISAGGDGGFFGMASNALAGAGVLAMGVGGGEGLKAAVMEDLGDDVKKDEEDTLARSPSPPLIEINVTADDGATLLRIDGDGFEDENCDFSDEELEKSSSPSPPPSCDPAPSAHFSPQEVEEMRRVLKFFFMDPIQKWKAKRRFPWKLCLQLLKIVFITVQLCLFGSQRSAFITFSESNMVAFEHLYLQDWDPALEGMPYPPPRGPYAVYDKETFFRTINYAINNYFNTSDLAVGTYAVHSREERRIRGKKTYTLHSSDDFTGIPAPQYCQSVYPNASVDPENNKYSFPHKAREECVELSSDGQEISIEEELAKARMTLNFDTLINVTLKFKVKTIHFRSLVALDFVTCYIFDVNILMDNHHHNGQIPVSLKIQDHWLGNCSGVTAKSYHEDEIVKAVLIFFDGTCVCVSFLSMLLCLRSLKRAFKLCDKTDQFLILHKGNPLSSSERWEFVNFWYLTIILNDILAIIGSLSKIMMETQTVIDWNLTGLALGTSNLLVWIGVLRYLSFFSRYNILIVTLKHAMPDLIRFLVCTLVLFFGFVFCGWAVLGPYNLKFRTIWSTMMCLFSLVNGDDMFVTFTASSPESPLVWYYSQIYLYAFICLFIYVNISLFTAVILDSYSLIKYYYQHGFPKSDLFEFIDECEDPPEGESYRQRSLSTLPMDRRRPKSRVSQHSISLPPHDDPTSSTRPRPNKSAWKTIKSKASLATANCFRCCRGESRRRKRGPGNGDIFNNARINRSDSHRQHLVYASESDDDVSLPAPGDSLHI